LREGAGKEDGRGKKRNGMGENGEKEGTERKRREK